MKKLFQGGILCLFLASYAQAQSVSNNALPTNPNIESGAATITQSTNQLTINQSTDKLITNWSSFNIGKDATVQFNQPSSTSSALNRVNSNDPSYIFGSLRANGQVILINPSGVIFGQGARFDAGSFIASTLNLKSSDFLNNKYIFERDPNSQAGSIENNGSINAFAGGTVAFIAPQIVNAGSIATPSGTAALLSGDKVTLTLSGNRLISYSVDVGTLNSLIENKNIIKADDGVVILSAKALSSIKKSVVNNSGIIEAKGITKEGGKVFLDGDIVINSGTINVSSSKNKGGNIQITGDDLKITSSARLIATGATGGGEILVGGSYQNLITTIKQAIKVIVELGALLDASATENGNGGAIVVWSNIYRRESETYAHGTFIANGGASSGDGGQIETSGYYLNTENATGSANSPTGGASGSWLFDPYSITINSSTTSGSTQSSGTYTTSATSNILNTDIQNLLNAGTSVSISTGGATPGADAGDITVSATITKSSGTAATLSLSAYRNVVINQTISSTSGALGLTVTATTGSFSGSGNLTLNGGALSVTQATAGTYSGIISGTGTTLTKAGVGTLTLGAANTYTGLTTVSAGSLTYGIANAISSGDVTVNGSTAILALAGFTDTVGAVTLTEGSITGTTGNTLTGTSYTLNPATGKTVAVSAILAGAVNLTKSDLGTANLSGVNTYSGTTTINASGGTLAITGAGQLGSGTYAQNIAIGSGSTFAYSSSATQTLSGIISGAGTFTKDTGSSSLTLTNTNTYTGGTNVNAGTLVLNHSSGTT